jgi:hypothetical protein
MEDAADREVAGDRPEPGGEQKGDRVLMVDRLERPEGDGIGQLPLPHQELRDQEGQRGRGQSQLGEPGPQHRRRTARAPQVAERLAGEADEQRHRERQSKPASDEGPGHEEVGHADGEKEHGSLDTSEQEPIDPDHGGAGLTAPAPRGGLGAGSWEGAWPSESPGAWS